MTPPSSLAPRSSSWRTLALALALPVLALSCHGDDEGDLRAGAACADPDECYPDVDREALVGDVLCLDKVPGGYCTHTCQSDADCCAAPDECPNGLPQVCAPFENTGLMMCFLTCESIPDDRDSDAYCQDEAHPDFICRSTGGGAANRRVCVP